MSGVGSEKAMEFLFNCTLYGEIKTSPKNLNSKSSIPMCSQSSSMLAKRGKLPSKLQSECRSLLINVYSILLI
jgi:hypothetical protein